MDIKLQPNITGTNVNLVKGATQADLTNAVNNAKTYRDEAQAFSIVSEDKSIESAYSALNASVSATTAIDKANIATNKATEANNSAINASASESVCIAKATIATDKADIATAQSVIATDKANEASISANTATTQAGIATTKASEASTSASNALTSENNADTSEANALIYRNQAESFANSINPSDLVHISGTETITGNKTFSGTVSGLTKATVGLSNVDNTSDANKPISTATQTALNTKVDKVTSTDNAVVRFDGTTGKLQNSGVIIDDNGNVGIGTSVINNKLEVNGSIGFGSVTGNGRILSDVNWGCLLQSDVSSPAVAEFAFLNNAGAALAWIDTAGNLLLKSGTGALGYGTGAGGTVTQLTSKSTAVTLNKPSGVITMNNAALAAGSYVTFDFINSTVSETDGLIVGMKYDGISAWDYSYWYVSYNGGYRISVKNNGPSTRSDALRINFQVIKGAIS